MKQTQVNKSSKPLTGRRSWTTLLTVLTLWAGAGFLLQSSWGAQDRIGSYDAEDCTTPMDSFLFDEDVCVVGTFPGGKRHIEWWNEAGDLRWVSPSTADSPISDRFTPDSSGTWTILLIRDSNSHIIAASTFTVEPPPAPPVNNPPALTKPGSRCLRQNTTLSFILNATDPDSGQTLTYSIVKGDKPGMTLDPLTGEFSWTPTARGIYTVKVRVSDSGTPMLFAEAVITILVLQ
jgi:hypothetical protein